MSKENVLLQEGMLSRQIQPASGFYAGPSCWLADSWVKGVAGYLSSLNLCSGSQAPAVPSVFSTSSWREYPACPRGGHCRDSHGPDKQKSCLASGPNSRTTQICVTSQCTRLPVTASQ